MDQNDFGNTQGPLQGVLRLEAAKEGVGPALPHKGTQPPIAEAIYSQRDRVLELEHKILSLIRRIEV